MTNPFDKLSPRQLYGLACTCFAFTILTSYPYLFKKPLTSYITLRQSRVELESKINSDANLAEAIKDQEETVAKLTERLYGESSAFPTRKRIAHHIVSLDRLALRHGVRLESVTPDSPQPIMMFEEIPLSMRVAGSYFKLYQWLHAVEKQLDPMVAKQFEILPNLTGDALTMNLKMVSYIPLEKK